LAASREGLSSLEIVPVKISESNIIEDLVELQGLSSRKLA
jgi:hypothetical protein